MADKVEEIGREEGARAHALNAYAAFLAQIKDRPPEEGGGKSVVVDAVSIDNKTGKTTSLSQLQSKAANLRREIQSLREKSASSRGDAQKATGDAQELDRQASLANAEGMAQKQEASRAEIEDRAEADRATGCQGQADEMEANSQAKKREADLLRAQGERLLESSQADGSQLAYQSGMATLAMAADKDRSAGANLGQIARLRGEAVTHNQLSQGAKQKGQQAKSSASEAERRASSLTSSSRDKQGQASKSRIEADGIDRQIQDRSMELELLEKKMDELIEMASQLEFLVTK